MDARVRTGADAYDASCPAPGAGATAGTSSTGAGTSSVGAGATSYAAAGQRSAPSPGMSESFGDVGMTDAAGNGHGPAEAFSGMGEKLGELKEFASYYLAAKLDAWKMSFRNLGVYAALGIVGLIAGSAIITTAAVLLLVGIALGIGKIFEPDQPWVGALIVGVVVLGGLAAGIISGMKWLTNTSRKRTVEKYENRQRDQRIYFGEDVRGRRAGH